MQIYFISTGRCGTTRLSEILDKYLPKDSYSITHQMNISRISNVIGNILFRFGNVEWIKVRLFSYIHSKYWKNENFISTDPLTAMMLPQKIIKSNRTFLIHIERDRKSFAESFFKFSRKRAFSFIAHNFIPFWQPGVFPLENILNKNIRRKYELVWLKKNNWFQDSYSQNNNYQKVTMQELFETDYLKNFFKLICDSDVQFSIDDLRTKSNISQVSRKEKRIKHHRE